MNPETLLRKGLDYQKLMLDDRRIEKLIAFIHTLAKWNRIYNLTAVRDIDGMVVRHLLDSLSIEPYVREFSRIADLGSGGGLPGIPLAICHPDKQFTLIDSNIKKTRFLRHTLTELELEKVTVVRERIEIYQPDVRFDCLVARAYASPSKILRDAPRLCDEQGKLILMAGRINGLDITGSQEFMLQSIHPLEVYGDSSSRHVVVFARNRSSVAI